MITKTPLNADRHALLRGVGTVAIAAFAMTLQACGNGSHEVHPAGQIAEVAKTAAEMCAVLPNLTVPATEIGLPTTGATITSAELVLATAKDNTNGEYCKVLGSIRPVDKSAPDIKFEADLPTHWNGKLVHFGGGGADGVIPNTTSFAISGFSFIEAPSVKTPLARGFITYGSDSGHQGNMGDGTFGANDEALANYAGAHVKKTHDVVAYLTKRHFGSPIKHSYYIGGSGGGRQGLLAAQRYPADHDGVISTFPASNLTGLAFQFGKIAQAFLAPGGFINAEKSAMVSMAMFKQCDADDGIADGIISKPQACTFEIASMRCEGGVDAGNTCLSDAQLKTYEAIASPLKTNFSFANGIQQVPGFTLFGPDFSPSFPAPLGASQAAAQKKPFVFADSSFFYAFYNDMVQYSIARDANLNTLSFNPADPGPLTARVQAVSALQDATTTDLAAFQSRGGKLILQHGTSDNFIPYQMTIDYYKRLEARYGSGALKQFVKFFLVPGAAHGFGGQFEAEYDGLTALDNWVVNGTAPGNLVATDVSPKSAGRTRPVCEYPQWPKYISGDVNSASSFTCVN